ncbi:MAG: hypothetical protein MI919_39195, partial [Holophagales bacterium]|nr:hypothetical protein [Holophagales bacterium]
GRLEAAADTFRRAVQLRPNYLLARAALVEALLILDREDEAASETEALERLAPGSAEATLARRLIEAPS